MGKTDIAGPMNEATLQAYVNDAVHGSIGDRLEAARALRAEIKALQDQVNMLHSGHKVDDNDSCNMVIRVLQAGYQFDKGLINRVRALCVGHGNETAMAVASEIDRARK